MHHYVYKIIDKKTKEFYIGSRSCRCDIKDDIYMGSPIHWKPNTNNLIKIIIRDNFKNRKSAFNYEAKLILKHCSNKLNRNYHIPTIGFTMKGKKHTEQFKQKNREKHIGKKHSLETRKKMSESHKGLIKTKQHRKNLSISLTGKIVSIEHRKNISEALKIPVLQYDINMNFIKEWDGQIDATRELGINHIGECCKGKIKSAGGFIWKFKGLQ